MAVLVTGCAPGIGAAAALKMAGLGLRVFAGVKTPEEGSQLLRTYTSFQNLPHSGGIVPVVLDLTRKDDIEDAVRLVTKTLKKDRLRLIAVVNNAAPTPEVVPLEALALDKLRQQLEVNIVGQLAVTQTFLPLLRQNGGRSGNGRSGSHGAPLPSTPSPRVIFVTCAPSRVPTPLLGSYHVGKRGFEAVANTLRLELQPWRIEVSMVSLGMADTGFMLAGISTMRENLRAMPHQLKDPIVWKPYEEMGAHLEAQAKATQKGDSKLSLEDCADAIIDALLACRPEVAYSAGIDSVFTMPFLLALPARFRDLINL